MESRGEAGNSGHHPSSARTPAEQAGATSVREHTTSQTYYLGKIEMRGLKVIKVINGIPPKRNCQLPLLLSGVIL